MRWPALVLPIALAIALVAVLSVTIAAVRWLSPAGDAVPVPTFVGMQYADAQNAAKRARLDVRIVARKPDYHAPKDRVVGQLPAAGEHVREGRIVDLVVSDGQPIAKVPNVANMSVRDATVTLENARLDVGKVTTEIETELPEGTVLSQKPEALSNVPAGMKIDLVVAKGRPIAYAPNFVGMPVKAAAAAAKDAHVGLAPSVNLPITAGAPPKGIIVAQDPPPGQLMKPHDKIALQVSGGAPPTPLPSPSPEPSELAPQAPTPQSQSSATAGTPASATPRGLRVSVALPESAKPARVRVVLVDSTGSRTLYDQQTRGGFTLSFDLSVTGFGTLQTFVGDTLVNSTQL